MAVTPRVEENEQKSAAGGGADLNETVLSQQLA
jgi:hypothetical protein